MYRHEKYGPENILFPFLYTISMTLLLLLPTKPAHPPTNLAGFREGNSIETAPEEATFAHTSPK